MGKINLVSIYEEIYKGTSHCAMCYRSCKQIRLVRSQVFKKIVEAISSNIVVQNATLCYTCEAHMTKFAYFLDSVQMVLNIHKLFMKAETSRKNIPLETKLMEQNLKLYEKKLMQFREQIDFKKTETMIVDFVEPDKRLRTRRSARLHKDTNVQPIKEKMNIFSTKKTVKKQNIDKEIITIDIPPMQPQIPTTTTAGKNTNHPIQPKTQSKNTKKLKQNISKAIKVTSNQSSRILTQYRRPYMPVLTIDGSSGTPQTRYTNLPLLPNLANQATEESKKEKSKILLPTMVCKNDSSKESIIDLENAKRIYEGEPVRKKIKLNTPKIYVVDNKYLKNQIVAKTKKVLIKKDNVYKKSPTKIMAVDKIQSILPKIVECKTDSHAFDATQTEKQDGEPIKGEIDWEARIPSELTTFVDCGDRWPLDVLKDENSIDNEDSVNSIIEVDSIEGDETSIIIVENQNNSICSVCDLQVTTETLKDHFINAHMRPPV